MLRSLSIRLRLTLWNATLLALILSVVAVAVWLTIRGVLEQRRDESVSEAARAIASTIMAERQAMRDRPDLPDGTHSAVRAALRELHSGDFDVLLYDDAANVVAAKRAPTRARAKRGDRVPLTTTALDPDTIRLAPAVRDLLRLRPDSVDVMLRSLSIDAQPWRAAVTRAEPDQSDPTQPSLIVAVMRSDEDDIAVLDRVRTAFLLAVPFALGLSILAGYLMARTSLAPVDQMVATAERISAETLDARLPVVNSRDELGRLATVMNELLARVDGAFRSQRQFIADASHELRTPLAIVRGESDVTLRRPTRDEATYREALEVIRSEAIRLSHIVDDLFLLARVDAAAPMSRRDLVDLPELVGAVARSVRTIADERNVQLEVVLPKEPASVIGDAALLRALIVNLLDNALKATPPDGRVVIALQVRATEASIRVSDTGPGVPAALRDTLFDRFVRGERGEISLEASATSARTPGAASAGGAGLGLAIARAIARAHHGDLRLAESAIGAEFLVTLPLV